MPNLCTETEEANNKTKDQRAIAGETQRFQKKKKNQSIFRVSYNEYLSRNKSAFFTLYLGK
jgi:hypothetical protein